MGSAAGKGKGGSLAAGLCRGRAAAASAPSAQAEAAAAGHLDGAAGAGEKAQRVLREAHRVLMWSFVLQ